MTSKRQTTMAKRDRERAVREKREKKREKKEARAVEKALIADGTLIEIIDPVTGERTVVEARDPAETAEAAAPSVVEPPAAD
jgi:hypothetical protein